MALSDENHEARPKPIIVLEDKPKSKDKVRDKSQSQLGENAGVVRKIVQQDAGHSPSAKQIEKVVNETHKAPVQAEVNESLEAIRDEATKKSTVISASRFEDLLQDLTKSYTIHQLGRYLEKTIRSSSIKVSELQTSRWRPGRTPLEQRHPREAKKKGPSTKLRVAEQILRLAWEITIETEENRDGELEIRLKPWQTSLLFGLASNGTRYLDGLVTPPALVQNSDVQLSRPDNVMRITGRCQTAEEIGRQLRLALLKVHRLQWDVKDIATSSGSTFRAEDMNYVAQLTESVIVPEQDGVLAIYSTNRSGTLDARRLLLSLLDRVGGSFNGVASMTPEAATAAIDMPIGNTNVGMHRRYHGLQLLRTVHPVTARGSSADDGYITAQAGLDNQARRLASELDSVTAPRSISTSSLQTHSYWRDEGVISVWKARYCTLLHTDDKGSRPASKEEASRAVESIVQHAVPGLETLSPHFDASQRGKKILASKSRSDAKTLPYIEVHLMPSPQDSSSFGRLPRLELRFHFKEPKDRMGLRELMLTGMQASIDEQRLSVPLPGYATDVQFTRKSKLLTKLDTVKADASIMAFVRQLQKSARNEEGALTAPAELSVKLPPQLVGREGSQGSATSESVTVKYLFERIEQIQRLDFTPRQEHDLDMDADTRSTLEALPKDLRLDYREVEGGAIYGNSTVLSLDFDRRQRVGRPSKTGESAPVQTDAVPSDMSSLELAGTALRIADLLTRANSGRSKHSSEKAREV